MRTHVAAGLAPNTFRLSNSRRQMRRTGSAGRCDQFAQALCLKRERKRILARSACAFADANRPQRRALPVRQGLPISVRMRLNEKYWAWRLRSVHVCTFTTSYWQRSSLPLLRVRGTSMSNSLLPLLLR